MLLRDLRTDLLSLALDDAALLSVTLYYASRSSLRVGDAGPPPDAVEMLTMKSRAISAIQQRLDENNLSDATIAAVACIIWFEVLRASLLYETIPFPTD